MCEGAVPRTAIEARASVANKRRPAGRPRLVREQWKGGGTARTWFLADPRSSRPGPTNAETQMCRLEVPVSRVAAACRGTAAPASSAHQQAGTAYSCHSGRRACSARGDASVARAAALIAPDDRSDERAVGARDQLGRRLVARELRAADRDHTVGVRGRRELFEAFTCNGHADRRDRAQELVAVQPDDEVSRNAGAPGSGPRGARAARRGQHRHVRHRRPPGPRPRRAR